jgi:ribonuclease D
MPESMSAEIAERAAASGRLAIDTEFVSERRYRALLCLAQVAVPDPDAEAGVRTEVLDPLDDLDPAPLARVLSDPDVEVVVHAGRQDVAIMRRTWRTEVRNIFDTQVAAGFLGLGNQEGYEQLVRKVLGVELGGSEGFTRWEQRPLTAKQVAYARDDARCLLALGDALEERLSQLGRLDWAREECRTLEEASDERDPRRILERLPRAGRLNARQRAVALELVAWREETAQGMDRPPGFLVPDHALVEVARGLPERMEDLERVRGLPQQTIQRRGRALIDAVERGKQSEPPPPPPEPLKRDSREAPLVALAQALVRHRALEARVAVELIATQAELVALVASVRRGADATNLRVTSGWRAELVGDELRELLSGRRRLAVDGDGQLSVEPV